MPNDRRVPVILGRDFISCKDTQFTFPNNSIKLTKVNESIR